MHKTAALLSIVLLAALFMPLSADAYVFLKNMRQGDSDPDVVELQKALNTNAKTMVNSSGAGSPGFETSYFGPATKRAVIAFQELYGNEILIPSGLTRGNGFVGKMTRQKLNTLSIGVTTQQTTTVNSTPLPTANPVIPIQAAGQSLLSGVPVITSLSTTTFGNGDKIIINGKNFEPKDTVLISIDFPDRFVDLPAASSTLMQFTFNSSISKGLKDRMSKYDANIQGIIVSKIREGMVKKVPSADGNWYYPATISVKNSMGVSNAIDVKLNILKGI